MEVNLQSTTRIVEINGVPGRVWEGVTAGGVRCYAVISQIAVHKDDDTAEFDRDLKECKPPSRAACEAFDPRMVL